MEAAIVKAACAIGAGIAMGFGAIGPAVGEGNAVGKALEAGVLTADIAPAGRGVRTAEATCAVLEQLEADCYVAELRD